MSFESNEGYRGPGERLQHVRSVGSPTHLGEVTTMWAGTSLRSSPRENRALRATGLTMTASPDDSKDSEQCVDNSGPRDVIAIRHARN